MSQQNIPKIIHYCWFGGNPLPESAKKCISSWKKHLPGYEIKCWNETNFSIEDSPLYVQQAYEAKKWAFVSDYARLYALTQFGGIYMDTDVEVVGNLDEFLNNSAFSGFEDVDKIPTGIMACEKGFPLFLEFLHYYDDISFINEDGTYNQTTNIAIMTEICLKKGLILDGNYQAVEGFALYPKDFFCPKNWWTGEINRTDNTVTIHHYDGSWFSEDDIYFTNLQQKLRKIMPGKFAVKLALIIKEFKFNGIKAGIKSIF